jgi:hypothetical protein
MLQKKEELQHQIKFNDKHRHHPHAKVHSNVKRRKRWKRKHWQASSWKMTSLCHCMGSILRICIKMIFMRKFTFWQRALIFVQCHSWVIEMFKSTMQCVWLKLNGMTQKMHFRHQIKGMENTSWINNKKTIVKQGVETY